MSSLLQQLESASAPKSEEQPVKQPVARQWQRATAKAWEEHTRKAIAMYRAVMYGAGWLTAFEIECRLGYAKTSSTQFLKKLREDHKLIERRNRDGAAKFDRRHGYQYRWIGD